MKFGYARISTPQQSLEHQISNLEAAGCEKIYSDVVSGARDKRVGFEKLNDSLRSGDLVVVTTLDRLGRSNRFLIQLIEEWKVRGIHLQILSVNIDTSTCQGKFMFDIMAALAEQERNLIIERIKSGIAGARARGRMGGRPRKLNKNQIIRLKELYDTRAVSIKELCTVFQISKGSLYNYLKK